MFEPSRGLELKMNLLRILYDYAVHLPLRFLRSLKRSNQLRHQETISDSELKDFFRLLSPLAIAVGLRRVGSNGDGGYVLPANCFDVTAVFSPGVDVNSSFELEFAARGIRCFLMDASVNKSPLHHDLFTFRKLFLGVKTSNEVISLSDWLTLERHEDTKRLLLQMDIEGSEWEVLSNLPVDVLRQFDVITIELHNLDEALEASKHAGYRLTIEKLTASHAPIWIHANNFAGTIGFGKLRVPRVLEVTFVLRENFEFNGVGPLNSPLSQKNNPRIREVQLDSALFGLVP